MLLPKQKQEDNPEEEVDPREELVNRLLEYQTYKEISNTLREKENLRKEIYTKMPEDIKNYNIKEVKVTSDVTLDDLVNAFEKFLIRQKEAKPLNTKVTEREITVSDRKIKIRSVLGIKKKVKFFELFEDYSKEYIVATFLAILEMAKENELKIIQNNNFDEIFCEVA